jgi:hypothetical protein
MTRLCGALLDNFAPAKRSEAYRGFISGLSSRIFNCSRAAQVMCCLALCLVIGGGAARATLITVDDPTFGPNSLVLDTNTGLEWLNLQFSQRLSGRQVLAQTGPGGTFAGFQYATRDQFVTLFTEVFGTSDLLHTLGGLDLSATINFATLFGPTGAQFCTPFCPPGGTQQLPTLFGLFGPVGPKGGTSIFFSYSTAPDMAGECCVLTGASDTDFLSQGVDLGSFLVAVPEPTLPILSVGLLGIAAVMLRRRPRRFNNPAP